MTATATAAAPLVLIAGGGTGGHVFPALAAADELRRLGMRVEFVGTAAGFEARLVPRHGHILHTLPVRGMVGKPLLERVRGAGLLAQSLIQARALVRQLRPAVALGVGGYASFPALVACWGAAVPIVIHEQNAVPGIANRLLARLARVIAVSYPESLAGFPGRTVLTGNPVRAGFFDIGEVAPGTPIRLLAFGGSQGSHVLNEALVAALPRLATATPGFHLVHQTGEREHTAVSAAYARAGMTQARVVPFLDDMVTEFAQAHLILSRSGATTSFELAAAGRPALLVPFAAAAGGHQEKNARALERAGAAQVLLESALSGESLAAALIALGSDPARLVRMGAAARTLARPEAARDLAQLIVGQMR